MRAVFDTVTGLLISSRLVQNIEQSRGGYQSDTTYILKQMSYNGEMDASLFHVPSTATKEVKELSKWDANKLKKQLAGKTAPDFTLTDLKGKTIRLSELKGQTVLLHFWQLGVVLAARTVPRWTRMKCRSPAESAFSRHIW